MLKLLPSIFHLIELNFILSYRIKALSIMRVHSVRMFDYLNVIDSILEISMAVVDNPSPWRVFFIFIINILSIYSNGQLKVPVITYCEVGGTTTYKVSCIRCACMEYSFSNWQCKTLLLYQRPVSYYTVWEVRGDVKIHRLQPPSLAASCSQLI